MNFILPWAILVAFSGGGVLIGLIYFLTWVTGADDRYVQKQKDDLQKQMDQVFKVTSKRGVFILAAELPKGGHTFISTWSKTNFGEDEGYHLLMFNELLLAKSYAHKFKEQLEDKKANADFPTNLIFIKEILAQEDWDKVKKILLSDNIKNALINPCLEEKTKAHNCIVRPIRFEKHPDFNELNAVFESIPNTHVNVRGENEDEIINMTVLDNY